MQGRMSHDAALQGHGAVVPEQFQRERQQHGRATPPKAKGAGAVTCANGGQDAAAGLDAADAGRFDGARGGPRAEATESQANNGGAPVGGLGDHEPGPAEKASTTARDSCTHTDDGCGVAAHAQRAAATMV